MTLADIITLAVIVVAGPWGLVLIVALFKGYDLRFRFRPNRRRRREE